MGKKIGDKFQNNFSIKMIKTTKFIDVVSNAENTGTVFLIQALKKAIGPNNKIKCLFNWFYRPEVRSIGQKW